MLKIHLNQGDVVKIKMNDHLYFDKIGKVETVLRNRDAAEGCPDAVLVNIDNKFHDWFFGIEENLEKIENFPEKT